MAGSARALRGTTRDRERTTATAAYQRAIVQTDTGMPSTCR